MTALLPARAALVVAGVSDATVLAQLSLILPVLQHQIHLCTWYMDMCHDVSWTSVMVVMMGGEYMATGVRIRRLCQCVRWG